MVFLLKEINLEGQDGEHFVNITFDILDAIFFPCPYLGGYIIIDRYLGIGLDEFGYLQIKARIIDQDDHVGLPVENVLLTHFHIAHDSGKMKQDGNKTHIGQFLVMLDARAPHSGHHITSEESELSLSVLFLQ